MSTKSKHKKMEGEYEFNFGVSDEFSYEIMYNVSDEFSEHAIQKQNQRDKPRKGSKQWYK